jgi:hypothetical protein
MKMRRVILSLLLTCLVLPGQKVPKVAPEVEAALKARVGKFWDGFVQGKYRLSDAYVADSAKEDFFSWPKKKIKGYTVDAINYTESGREARVMTLVDTSMAMMGVGAMDIKQPVETWWKQEEGEWFWFLPKNQVRETPFGKMESNPQSGEAALAPTGMMGTMPDLNKLMSLVKPDRQAVKFELGKAGSEKIEFTNGMPGTVVLTIDTPPGEEITYMLNSKTLPRGGKGYLTINYEPGKLKEKFTRVVRVGVAQTGKLYPIQVTVEPKEQSKPN